MPPTTREAGRWAGNRHIILKDNGLWPNQVKTFKVSRDPNIGTKSRDAFGHCVCLRGHLAVLPVDEKTQVQAFGRTQRPLPQRPQPMMPRQADARAWLTDRPDCTFHFTPDSASWMKAFQGFFSKISRQSPKEVAFNSLEGPIAAIEDQIAHHNSSDARPFRWSKNAGSPRRGIEKKSRELKETASN